MNNKEINMAIAEHVIGWTWWTLPGGFWEEKRFLSPDGRFSSNWGQAVPCLDMTAEVSIHGPDIPDYCKDIAAAWTVVETFKRTDFRVSVDQYGNECDCLIDKGFHPTYVAYEGESNTAPMAICIAALKAKGIDYER